MFAIASPFFASSGSVPASHARKASTAYSGSTAMKAMIASASPCEMSISAVSAAQLSRNAAARMAMP